MNPKIISLIRASLGLDCDFFIFICVLSLSRKWTRELKWQPHCWILNRKWSQSFVLRLRSFVLPLFFLYFPLLTLPHSPLEDSYHLRINQKWSQSSALRSCSFVFPLCVLESPIISRKVIFRFRSKKYSQFFGFRFVYLSFHYVPLCLSPSLQPTWSKLWNMNNCLPFLD